jgi:PIN domain nuclease of toxin-antitoxin system
VKLLLDTHAFLWFLRDDPRLSNSARELIEDGSKELFLSVASAWELASKVSLGKLALEQPLETFLPEQMQVNEVQLLPVTLPHVLRVTGLPWRHRDPFDRLLVAQCLVEQMPIVSANGALSPYGVQRLW